MKINHQPIGIFDSGIGGLTVAHALVKHLPKENILYFGDTAHMPYGERSSAAILQYSLKIAKMLLDNHCKLILIACNSASAIAYEAVKNHVGDKALVMNVIDPVIDILVQNFTHKQVGLIGTKLTVNSAIYQKQIDAKRSKIKLQSLATNILASAIEEFGDHELIDNILEVYLSQPTLKDIDALVLACTHYPLIKERIAKFYNHKISVIDSSDIVAQTVRQKLSATNLLHDNGGDQKHFYVSDYTASFAHKAKLFFGEDIKLEELNCWDQT